MSAWIWHFPCGSGAAFICGLFSRSVTSSSTVILTSGTIYRSWRRLVSGIVNETCVCSERWSHVFTETASVTVLFFFFTRCHAAKLTFKWDSLKHYFLFFFLHFNVFTSAENLPDVMSRLTLSFAYARAKKKKKNTSQISSINLNRALMFAAWMRWRLRLQRLFPGIKTLNTWIFFVTPFA